MVAAEPVDRLAIRRALEQSGLVIEQLEECAGAEAALPRCKAVHFDCLLVDNDLPDIGGIELTRALREASNHTPVVLMTNSIEEELLENAAAAGVTDFFMKSDLSPRRLALRVRFAIRIGRAETESTRSLAAATQAARAHVRGIVHRDLKPDNLLLTDGDRDFPLRVLDWGVARLGPRGRLTLEGMTPGTPIYMSPEQATGTNIGTPCDIYSLGVIAYETLAGHPPFDGRTLAEVVAMHLTSEPRPLRELCDAPPQLCTLIHRMLDKLPHRRPSATEVRRLARAIALELEAGDYHELEISRPRGWPPYTPSDEVVIVDPEVLELGDTEMLPTIVPKPRWTPATGRTIVPKAARDQIAGEIISRR